MIVVTAAAGRTGTAVVRALRARGLPVRAVVGRPEPRPDLVALGAEVVAAGLADPSPWPAVLGGADALYLIWPNFDPGEAEGAAALFAAARRAGVGRVVYHSVLRPQARAMPHHAAKDRAEEVLDRAGVAWRVLQPCAYAQNLDEAVLQAARTAVLRSTWGLRTAQSLIDVADVGEAAAVLLTGDGLDGGTFEVAGPEPLTAPRLAALLGAALDRPVVAEDAVPSGGVPAAYPERCLRLMLDHYRAHGFTGSPRVATALLGRPPRSYAQHLAGLLGAP
ncbi:SDR family oxidoreductase [Trujillonella humicola]|uniref:SDR family oxidoreductase n=1 Tax=Trujillonella humicola TaxID=3383699 RepID=UPI003905FCAD